MAFDIVERASFVISSTNVIENTKMHWEDAVSEQDDPDAGKQLYALFASIMSGWPILRIHI